VEVDLRRLQRQAAEGADRQLEARRLTRRVAVIGNAGSGKTTLARALARRLGVPHVELDALFWNSGWVETPAEEFRRRVEAVLDDDEGWVADGNYRTRLGSVILDRAELVVWTDPPLPILLTRLARRTVRRARTQEQLWGTNVDTWRSAFMSRESVLLFALKAHRRWRPRGTEIAAHWPVVRLRSRSDVERFLADVG
jgi:adenylate kinase family enzyme